MRRPLAAVAVAVAIAVTAAAPATALAKRQHHGSKPSGTVVDVAVKASGGGAPDRNPYDFDLLVQAVTATGLAPVLADRAAKFTVFAPNEGAFQRLVADLTGSWPQSEAAALAAITGTFTAGQIRNVLLYHVVAGRKLGPLQVLFSRSLTMANGGVVRPRGLRLRDERRIPRPAPAPLRARHPGRQRRHPRDQPRARAGHAVAPGSDGVPGVGRRRRVPSTMLSVNHASVMRVATLHL